MKLETKCKCGESIKAENPNADMVCPQCGENVSFQVIEVSKPINATSIIGLVFGVLMIVAILFVALLPQPIDYTPRVTSTLYNLQSLRTAIETYYAMTGNFPSPDLRELYTAEFRVGEKNRTLLKYIPAEIISVRDLRPADMNPPNRRIYNQLNGQGGWFYDPVSGDVFINWNQPLPDEWRERYAGQNPSRW